MNGKRGRNRAVPLAHLRVIYSDFLRFDRSSAYCASRAYRSAMSSMIALASGEVISAAAASASTASSFHLAASASFDIDFPGPSLRSRSLGHPSNEHLAATFPLTMEILGLCDLTALPLPQPILPDHHEPGSIGVDAGSAQEMTVSKARAQQSFRLYVRHFIDSVQCVPANGEKTFASACSAGVLEPSRLDMPICRGQRP